MNCKKLRIEQRIGIVVVIGSVLGVFYFVLPAYAAHPNAIVHSEDEVVRQEKIIAILTQLIALVKQQKELLSTVEPTLVEDVTIDSEESISEVVSTSTVNIDMDHHEKHHLSTSTPKLVIEVETHGNNTTHVHVRYPDKPEEQFFITASFYDEEAVIRDIRFFTGLSESVIRPALLYFY